MASKFPLKIAILKSSAPTVVTAFIFLSNATDFVLGDFEFSEGVPKPPLSS